MERKVNWPRELNLYLLEVQEKYTGEIVWGELDCVIFGADWVIRCTVDEVDLIEEFRGRYHTKEEALLILKEVGGSLYQACRKKLGNPVPGVWGHRGDIAYSKQEKAIGFFITQGTRMQAVFLTDNGLTLVSAKEDHLLAFRV